MIRHIANALPNYPGCNPTGTSVKLLYKNLLKITVGHAHMIDHEFSANSLGKQNMYKELQFVCAYLCV